MPLQPDAHKTLLLPPGFAARQAEAPWRTAIAEAGAGLSAGSLFHACDGGLLQIALILAPDQPIDDETGLRLATLAVLDALIAVVPPETTVSIPSTGMIAVNHGEVAVMTIARGPALADAVPAWLVMGFTLRVALKLDAPGLTPWLTDLAEEGIDVSPTALIEGICRHLLSGIDSWQADGDPGIARVWNAALHATQPA